MTKWQEIACIRVTNWDAKEILCNLPPRDVLVGPILNYDCTVLHLPPQLNCLRMMLIIRIKARWHTETNSVIETPIEKQLYCWKSIRRIEFCVEPAAVDSRIPNWANLTIGHRCSPINQPAGARIQLSLKPSNWRYH